MHCFLFKKKKVLYCNVLGIIQQGMWNMVYFVREIKGHLLG